MTEFQTLYMIGWGLMCLLAAFLAVKHRKSIALFQGRYWRFLLRGWKVVSFLVAAIGMIVIAPYTGDPTWDYVDAAFMSILAFTTAPWVIGTIYLTIRRQTPWVHGYIAACIWLFSASWSYDLYLVLRDGSYPITWLPNIFASSVLYVCAGLTWNLEWRDDRGVIFGFMASDWLDNSDSSGFSRIVLFALPFMLIVGVMILSFII